MLKNLFSRHGDAHTVMESPDVATTSRAPSVEYASLSRMAVAQAGPAARHYVSAPSELSPIVRAAAERITGHPVS